MALPYLPRRSKRGLPEVGRGMRRNGGGPLGLQLPRSLGGDPTSNPESLGQDEEAGSRGEKGEWKETQAAQWVGGR